MNNFEKERNEEESVLYKIRYYSSENLDKQIVFISSGALLISMGFIEKIVDVSEALWKSLLIISWCLFTASILMNLISHQTAIKAVDSRIEENHSKEKHRNTLTQALNYISIGSLFVGLILLIIFVTLNM